MSEVRAHYPTPYIVPTCGGCGAAGGSVGSILRSISRIGSAGSGWLCLRDLLHNIIFVHLPWIYKTKKKQGPHLIKEYI